MAKLGSLPAWLSRCLPELVQLREFNNVRRRSDQRKNNNFCDAKIVMCANNIQKVGEKLVSAAACCSHPKPAEPERYVIDGFHSM
jgi:hypothetical protein